MSSLSLQELMKSLKNLGVNEGECIVRLRKGGEEVSPVYEGVTSIVSEERRQTKKYKVKLHDGDYDGEVQCILADSKKITAVEITGHGTMHYNDGRRYTGDFLQGQKDGKGTMEFPELKRTYTGIWIKDNMSKNGMLNFEGISCEYKGEIDIHNLCMDGKGIFKNQVPLYRFEGIFKKDIPVSGDLEENSNLGPQTMKKIAQVSILQQKPKELDEQTRTKYEQDLAAQRESEKRPMRTSHTVPQPYNYNSTDDYSTN